MQQRRAQHHAQYASDAMRALLSFLQVIFDSAPSTDEALKHFLPLPSDMSLFTWRVADAAMPMARIVAVTTRCSELMKYYDAADDIETDTYPSTIPLLTTKTFLELERRVGRQIIFSAASRVRTVIKQMSQTIRVSFLTSPVPLTCYLSFSGR